jgi:molybdate-binding protein
MEMNLKPKAYIAVAPGAIYDYPSNRNDYTVEVKKQAYLNQNTLDYMKNLDIEKYCLYSDEDDNNKEKFTRFIKDINSKEVYLQYYNHFDGYHRIYKIPELIQIINDLL